MAHQQATTPEVSQEPAYHHLPPEESAILKRQVIVPEIKTGLASLYRYASRSDMMIISVSCILSIGSGAALPLMTVLFGNLQGTLQGYFQGNSTGGFQHELNKVVLYFVYLAVGNFVATYIYTVGFIYTGEHIAAKIREKYLEHCLRQNIAYFDQVGAGEITTRITADTNLVQEAISQKVGLTLAGITTFFAAFVIGFVEYWKLTLILSSTLFAILVAMGVGSKYVIKYSKLTINAYSPGGSLAEEVLGSIRNTVAFGVQGQLKNKYDVHLRNAERYGFRSKIATAILVASMISISNLGYALAFWVGGQYVVYEGLAFEKVLVTVMAVLMGAFSLGTVGSHASAIFTGVAAINKIYRTINRQSPLDPCSESGETPEGIVGSIKIENIKHIYPSRPGTIVMDGVSLEIPAGKKTALVGASGSGKSTIIGLIERFYEPVGGKIFLDGHDISTLNLRWLRQQIALVSQEPVLFGTTIYENIKYGIIGTKFESEDEATQRKYVIEAAKKANAHDFIGSLPDGYKTNVGTRGFLLSGGQKQRIAIARAIISNPKILLLDEATSALDTKSEGVVQAALDAASKGRTTITIAHRLSTIRNYDNIVVMSAGKVVEQGTHDELVQNQGPYYDLVATQNIGHQNDDTVHNEKNWNQTKEDRSTQVASEEGSLAQVDEPHASELHHGTTADPETSANLSHGMSRDKKYSFWDLAKLAASLNRREKTTLIIGLIFAIISGGCTPVQAVLLAKAISNLSTPLQPSNLHQVKKESDFWAAMYVMLGGVLAVSYCVHGVAFARSSERLLRHARSRVFQAILKQDVSFFDENGNTPGGLTSFLSTKTTDLVGLSGSSLGNILTSATTLIAGLAVGITIGWKLGLVSTSAVPILIICGYLRVWILAYFQSYSKEAYASSASFASEAVSNIHTVASLTREKQILQHYRKSLSTQQKSSLYSILKSSILFAFSESFILLILALCFWYGGTLIVNGEYSMFQFFVCFASVIFSAQATGAIFSDASSMSKAYLAAKEIKSLLDRKPKIETHGRGGESMAGDANGRVEFRNVHFHYPTRPNQSVLSGIDIDIQPGQFVAFVGSSGCGKSTSISLLERFYDPTEGGVFIDGTNIKDHNVNTYRTFISLVSQEPTLYQGTIKENIVLGASDGVISEQDIEAACRDANIYEFIISLTDGFDTVVGNRGMLLSGGQKQRIAIARALIRNPKILLLDEATSALDSESEHVVQAALDKAAKGRTTIAVAHRLSTIQKADNIFVFDQGRIVEQGTHADLIARGGSYAELVKLQSLEDNSKIDHAD